MAVISGNKFCYKCNIKLDSSNWYKSSKKNWINLCINCTKKKTTSYNKENPEIHRKAVNNHYKRNITKERKRKKQWKKDHPENTKFHKAKQRAKRKGIKTETILNKRFKDSDLHHMGNGICIFIPQELHRNIYHSLTQDTNMDKINGVALLWIQEQNHVQFY